jgi:hypothetical protein
MKIILLFSIINGLMSVIQVLGWFQAAFKVRPGDVDRCS